MASLEIVALDTVTPQLRAPGVGDTYAVPRTMISSVAYPSSAFTFSNAAFFAAAGAQVYVSDGTNYVVQIGASFLTVKSTVQFAWSSGTPEATAPDIGLARTAAGIVKVTNGSTGSGVLQIPTFTVATLPTAASAGAGARSTVSDGSVVAAGNFGAIVAGAGANIVPVYSDATNWRIG